MCRLAASYWTLGDSGEEVLFWKFDWVVERELLVS